MKQKTLIIAEAGVNHNGDLKKAYQLVDVAAEAGVDYVKFQIFEAKNMVSTAAKKADYQIENTENRTETQFEMLQRLQFSQVEFQQLQDYCEKKKVNFFATAFDLDSMRYLKTVGLELVKIPSGEITNYPYLKLAAQLFDKAIISTGMSNMDEIKAAVNVFLHEGIKKENITVLHCNTEYPTPMEDVNLRAMLHIQQELDTTIGYSDHTMGIEVPIAAVALGAAVIEKHFTLDRNLKGPDHRASLEPDELVAMVKGIRNIEKAISGDGIKKPSKSELKNKFIARKSIVASQPIVKGTIFTTENITTKRPGSGISAMKWEKVIGKIAKRDFSIDEPIEL